MSKRFLDDKEFVIEGKEFAKRRYVIPLWKLMLILALCFFLAVVIYNFYPGSCGVLLFSSLSLFVLLFACSYIIDSRYRDLITAVEFQNALFAGAARLATEFCLIARHDGKIVYIDPEYDRNIFRLRNNKIRNIKSLLDIGEVSGETRDKLIQALNSGKSEKIPFKLHKPETGNKSLALTIDAIQVPSDRSTINNFSLSVSPLLRPSGYSLLRIHKEEFRKEYEEYIEDFNIGFYTLKNSGEFSYVNEFFEKILGYNKGEIIESKITITDILFDHDLAKDLRSVKKDWQEVIVFRGKTNIPIYMFLNQGMLKNNSTKTATRHGVAIPLTKEVLIENETSNNKVTKSQDLIKYSPISTAFLDNKGNILDFNRSFRDLTGYNGTKKSNIFELIKQDTHETVKSFFGNVLEGKNDGAKPVDVILILSNTEEKAASLYLNRVTDTYGQLQGLIVHLIDTTELKNLELRFVHSQKMQAVGQLAGGIAHDFNNLLTAMMGFCDLLLLRHPAGDSSFADIMQIKQNANRAANLVRQLLAFSRKQTMQPQIINITDALADLSNLIGRLIGENIELEIVHGRDLKFVKVDQVQLEQVVINLAVNARDAMSDGGTLSVTTSNIVIDQKHPINKNFIPPAEDEVIEDGEYVLIEVGDTGHGMSRDIIGKVFEPFFSTKAIGAGTGLGLSTVYGIVKQTGGYIYVSSKPGKGTKFSIFLKACEHPGVANVLQAKLREEQEKSEADLTGTGTILLVEDETPVRIFSNNALTNKGYTVLDADCAETAMELMKEHGKKIDVIITDVVMPGMSGPDMIEKINKKYPNIKVIFISGYGEDAFIETYGTERKFNFLSKPYSLKQLILKVKEVMV